MTHDDGQELPTKHKERGKQTNQDNNLDNWVCHFVGPHVGSICEEFGLSFPFVQLLLREKVGSNFRLLFAQKVEVKNSCICKFIEP